MPEDRVYFWEQVSRAEAVCLAPSPALTEAQLGPGVRLMNNLTIPREQLKFHIAVMS